MTDGSTWHTVGEVLTEKDIFKLKLHTLSKVIYKSNSLSAGFSASIASKFRVAGLGSDVIFPICGVPEAPIVVTRYINVPRQLVTISRTDAAYNVVGPARNSDDALRLEDHGLIPPGATLIIMKPGTNTVCAYDEIGEIAYSSAGTASSYWGLDSKSAKVFNAAPCDVGGKLVGATVFLRTGLSGFTMRDVRKYVAGLLSYLATNFTQDTLKSSRIFVLGNREDFVSIEGKTVSCDYIQAIVSEVH